MYTSPIADVSIPDVSVHDFLFGSLTPEDCSAVAIIDSETGDATSYGELVDQIDSFAGALAARGARLGTVVALLCPNVPAFATVFHGVLRLGAVVTTLNSLYTAREIEAQLRDANAEWLVTVLPLLPQAKIAAAAVGISDEQVVVIDGAQDHVSLRRMLAERKTPPEVSFDPATHVAVLPYSSGTTGVPKGVMLTHRNLVANVSQCGPVIDVERHDRVLAVLPFFHIYGMTVLLNLALHARAALVTMARFDLVAFLTAIQNYRCTYVFVAPPIAVALAKHPVVDDFDISSVRTMLSGAAPLDGDTGEAASRRIHARMLQGFGMTELSPVSHVIPPSRMDLPVSSIGILLPNQHAKLVDVQSGTEVTENGRPGELWVRGPNVMLGYLNRPDATAEILDAEGFLHTGDVAVHHADDSFTIVDRVKELIKYKGYQIAPAELEALMLSHPKIMDVACIGVRDVDGEEVPKAFVVVAPGSTLGADEVMTFVSEQVAPYKKVRRIEFVEAIPKSASGKIMRRDLRAREAAGQ